MRRALVVMMIGLLAAPAVAQQRQPARAPVVPWGWDVGTDRFERSFADADQRNGYRLDLLSDGCIGAAYLICDLELRGVPVRVRATMAGQITEVEIALSRQTSTANGFAALHTLLGWAEPQATRDERRQAVQQLMDGGSRVEVTLRRTHITGMTGWSGFTITARPVRG